MGCVHPPPQRNRRICRPRWHMSTRGALGFPLVALLLCPDSNPIRLSPERLYRQDFLRRSPLRNQKGQLSPCFLKKENFRIQRAHPLLRRTLLVFLVSPAPPWTPLHHLLFPRAPSHLPTPKRRHRYVERSFLRGLSWILRIQQQAPLLHRAQLQLDVRASLWNPPHPLLPPRAQSHPPTRKRRHRYAERSPLQNLESLHFSARFLPRPSLPLAPPQRNPPSALFTPPADSLLNIASHSPSPPKR